MQVDFTDVSEVADFASVPEGTYACRISEVREGRTRDGSVRWAVCLVVDEGEYAGRVAAWDGLTFSERGMPRVKGVLECLGFDVSGVIELESSELVNRTLRVRVVSDEWEDPQTGQRRIRMVVPYRGYEPDDEPGRAAG